MDLSAVGAAVVVAVLVEGFGDLEVRKFSFLESFL